MDHTDYGFTEEQTMIRDTVGKFAADEVEPSAIDRDASREYPTALVEQLSEMALFGIPVPEDLGGAGLDTLSYALAVEELAKSDGSLATILVSHVSLGLAPIVDHGTDAQKEAWVGKLAMGEALVSMALPSPNGADALDTPVVATRDGDGWRLSGSPTYVISGARCGLFLVPAVTDAEAGRDGVSMFLIESGTEGVTLGDQVSTLGCRGADIRTLGFDGARVGTADLLGAEGGGRSICEATLATARIAIGAMSVGIAQAALDKALPYSDERHAFDQPLHGFDGIARRLTETATETHAARLMVYHAARRRDADDSTGFGLDATMARHYASAAAIRATDHAIQVLGGYGYSREYHVERYYRDAMCVGIGDGSPEQQRGNIVAAMVEAGVSG